MTVANRGVRPIRAWRQPSQVLLGMLGVVATLPLPWCFGGVHAATAACVALILPLILVLALIAGAPTLRDTPVHPLWAVLGICLLGLLQLLPLPPTLHQVASPLGHQLSPVTLNSAATHSTIAWRTPTVDAGLTRSELAFLGLVLTGLLVFLRTLKSPFAIRTALAAIAINGALTAFFGIAQSLSWNERLYWTIALAQGGNPFAAFVNRNNAGGFLNICLGAGIGWLLLSLPSGARRAAWFEAAGMPRTGHLDGAPGVRHYGGQRPPTVTTESLVALVCVTILLAGLIASASRGALLSSSLGLAVVLGRLLPGPRVRTALAVVLLAGGFALSLVMSQFLGLHDRIQSRLRGNPEGPLDSAGRLTHWAQVVRGWPNYWRLGCGLGTYPLAYRPLETRYSEVTFYHAENQYLEVFVNGGLPALCLTAFGVLSVGWHVFRSSRAESAALSQAAGTGAIFAVVTQAVQAALDYGLYLPSNALTLSAVVAASYNAGAAAGTPSAMGADAVSSGRPSRRGLLCSCWGAIAVTGGTIAFGLYSAQEYLRLAVIEQAQARTRLAASPLEEAENHQDVGGIGTAADESWQAPWLLTARPLREDSLRKAIEAMRASIAWRSYDGSVHVRLAELRLQLARLREFRRLAGARFLEPEVIVWRESTLLASAARWGTLDDNGRRRLRESPDWTQLLEPAWADLANAAKASPLMGRAYAQLAELSLLLQPSRTAELAARSVALAGGSAPRIVAAGVTEQIGGRRENAIRYLRRGLMLAPWLSADLALAERALPEPLAPEAYLPDNPAVWLDVAAVYVGDVETQQRLARGVLQLTQQQAAGSEDAMNLRYSSQAHRILGQLDQATAALVSAVKSRPDDPELRIELATLLLLQQRRSESLDQANAALALDPQNRRARSLRDKIRSGRN